MDDRQARQLVATVESSLERLDSLPESDLAAAHDAITRVCELYGEALRRLLAEGRRREDGSWFVRFARTDEVVSHLLLLHGLHPDGEAPFEKLLAAAEVGVPAPRIAGPREPDLVRLGTPATGRARARNAGSTHGNPAP
jgi:hypothetical protein